MVRERDFVGQTDSADFHAKTGPGSASRPIGAGSPWRATESDSDVCLVLSIRGWWSRLAMRRPIMPASFGEWSDRAVIACVDRVSVVPPRPTSYVARKSCHVMMGAGSPSNRLTRTGPRGHWDTVTAQFQSGPRPHGSFAGPIRACPRMQAGGCTSRPWHALVRGRLAGVPAMSRPSVPCAQTNRCYPTESRP